MLKKIQNYRGTRMALMICEAMLGGGAHVPRLNFTTSYFTISEHSRVACRNLNNNFLARYQSDNPHSLQQR